MATYTLTLTDGIVEALPSEQYVFQMYGLEGLNLLDKLITALQNPEFLYGKNSDILILLWYLYILTAPSRSWRYPNRRNRGLN